MVLFKSCFKPKTQKPKPDPKPETKRIQVVPNSPKRLSVSDLSNAGSETISSNDISSSLLGSYLHAFTLDELRVITSNFSYSSNFIGEGGFGAVYKGFINDKLRPGLKAQTVAIKVLDLDGPQGHKEWLAEVIFLGQLRHPNLVKLIGYCCENEQRVLVYEYMARGNLDAQLFKRSSVALPWLKRIKIAHGAAKGLAFLHEESKPVIFRDFKPPNILLDHDFKAKLSDFGFARDGPDGDKSHITTDSIMGTKGYVAPEYVMTGHLTIMSDVYSFGVVLLELLTGKRSIDKTRPKREHRLVEWARPLLNDPKKLDIIMDPRLEGQYSAQGAKVVAMLAYRCLSHLPKARPTMRTAVKILESVMEMKDIPIHFVYEVPKEKEKEEEEMNNNNNNNVSKIREKNQNGNKHRHYALQKRLGNYGIDSPKRNR